ASVRLAAGKSSGATANNQECGCPLPAATNMPAVAEAPSMSEPTPNPSPVAAQPAPSIAANETQPAPPAKPNDVRVEVDAPFVFRAEPLPTDSKAVAALRTSLPPEFAAPQVVEPAGTAGSAARPSYTESPHQGLMAKLH